MPDLVSDGGVMTVGRRTANYTYGAFEVTLPEGVQQGDPEDDRIVDAYIYRPDDRGVGRAELTFVRADVRVDMNALRSDLESTLDGASRRTQGDVFYSRKITGRGLGRKRPGVDYALGSVLDVLVWGKIMSLPVTAIRYLSSPEDPVGCAVQVGGQVLSDPEALRKRNDDLAAQIASEKKQRLREVGSVRETASSAHGTASDAKSRVETLTQALTGTINGDLTQAVAAHTGIAGEIMVKAEEFGAWSVEKQEDLNWSFALSQSAQATVNDVNLLAWTTQAEWNAQTQAQLRMHSEQFILHDNQLKWLSWTKHFYDFAFSLASGSTVRSGDSITSGLVDIDLNVAGGFGYQVTLRPGWRGRWQFEWTEQGGAGASESRSGWEDGTRTQAVASIHEATKVLRMGRLSVWPEHSAAPREWAVQIITDDGGAARFVAPEGSMGTLIISGAPTQVGGGAVRFDLPVVADGDVLSGIGVVPSGMQIPAGVNVTPASEDAAGLVLFTEVKPALTWEAGAPLTGRQYLPIASQTLPQSEWVTLAEWTGLAWSSPRTAEVMYTLQWDSYSAWSLADYYTRVTLNGERIGYLARSTVGGMDTFFKIALAGVTLAEGDVLTFEARTTSGAVPNRKITSAAADIVWA